MTAQALATVPAPDPRAVASALALTLTATEAAARDTLAALADVTLDTDEDYQACTAMRTAERLRADEFEAAYEAAVKPWRTIVTAIQEAFRPGKKAYAAVDARLKTLLDGYALAKAKAQREAEAAAQAAARVGDSPAVLTALATAQEAAAPLEGGRTVLKWVIAKVNADLVTREWLCVDTAKIEAFAKAHGPDDKPEIAGVTFELAASTAVTRRAR